jgi:phage shock protein A
MNIDQLKQLLERRVQYLTQTRAAVLATGDLAYAEKLAEEIASCQETLAQLESIV